MLYLSDLEPLCRFMPSTVKNGPFRFGAGARMIAGEIVGEDDRKWL